MKNSILSLQIESFRGAIYPLNIEFDPAKKITMIFGENGNGKSTIADAIIALFTDSIGSLQDKSSVDRTYLTSLSSNPEKLKLSLKTTSSEYTAKHSKTAKALIRSSNASDYSIRELRRSQIITLIDTEPSRRYESLREYIDVENIYKAEEELRKLCRSLKTESDQLIGIITSASSVLNDSWNKEGKPGKEWETWAKEESLKDISVETDKYNTLNSLINTWNATVQSYETYINSEKKHEEQERVLNALKKRIEEKEKENKEQSSELLKILKDAKKYIEQRKDLKKCPVCNNDIKGETLVSQLQNRINVMNELDTLTSQLSSAKSSIERSGALMQNSKQTSLGSIKKLLEEIQVNKEIDKKLIESVYDTLSDKKEDEQLLQFTKGYISYKVVFDSLKYIADRKKKAIEQHNLINTHYQSIIDNTTKAEKTEKLVKVAEGSLKIVENERKSFIDKELASISADVETLYASMHPDEGLGGIRLFLKPNTKNSLELKAKFHTSGEISPQSLYSESHLDTLGLCIFIALAKKYGNEKTILILDDVLMSVDDKHLDRFIQLIHVESDHFAHILLTTHYRPWRDRYRHHRAPANEVHFIELKDWSLEKGIRIQNGRIDIDDLRDALESDYYDRQAISNRAGTLLENMLDKIAILYSCRLPRKPGNDYVLRELLDAPSSKLLKVLKVQHMGKTADGKVDNTKLTSETEMKPIFESLRQLTVVRNQVGSHFNFDGSLVSDKDVREFGEFALKLATALICPECGAFPDKDKSGSYFESKSGFVRLFPVKEPAN